MPLGASDDAQLLGATAQGRAIFTFNIRDFMALSRTHVHHGGIVLAAQQSWPLPRLIEALDRFLRETEAQGLVGRVVWLRRHS